MNYGFRSVSVLGRCNSEDQFFTCAPRRDAIESAAPIAQMPSAQPTAVIKTNLRNVCGTTSGDDT